MTSSRIDTSVSGAPSGSAPGTAPSQSQPSDLTTVDISRDTLTADAAKAKESPVVNPTSEKSPSLSVKGTDLDAERAKNAEPVLGLDLDKVTEVRKATTAAINARHEELQNAGFEDAAAPAGIPTSTTARPTAGAPLSGRSAEQQREILQGESLLLTGKSKKKTGNVEIDDFIEQHPELVPLVAKIQQELAAVERAKSAGESGLESKSNLEAALDRIATLLEGQPLSPQLRLGDRAAKGALVELLTDGEPQQVKVAEVVVDDIQRRLQAKNAVSSTSITREELERFTKDAERIGRFQGLVLSEGSKSRADAEVGVAEARGALEKGLKEAGCDTPEVRELLTTIERQAAERERMARVSERIYELQLQASITEGRATNAAAVQTLKDYISDQSDLLKRNKGYREELAKHQEAARAEGTKLLRSCREAAAEIERASYYSFFDGATNEGAIFKALEGRSQREVKLIDELFSEDFGKGEYKSVEGLIRGEMEGDYLARGLKAFRCEGSPTGRDPRAIDSTALATLSPKTDTVHAIEAIVTRDSVRASALALQSAASSGADPVLSMVGVLESATARGVSLSAISSELEKIGFDPARAVGRDSAETGKEVPQQEAIGRALIEEALATGVIDDEKLFSYAQLRSMEHGGNIGALEAEENVPTERIARLNGTYAAEIKMLTPFLERHPETSSQLEQMATLASTQVRVELINQRVTKLAREVGIREYERNPDALKDAQAKLDGYLASKRECIASVQGHEAAIPVLVDQAKQRGFATMNDVAAAVAKYNVATDHWFSFMADADTAADVLRGKSTEWIVLFKQEFERVHGSNTAIGVANGILSGAEFDRVHSLMHRDGVAATAADVEIAMSDEDRTKLLAAVKPLQSERERAEFREVFNPRYAAKHSMTVEVPDPRNKETGSRSVTYIAKDFDEALGYTFSGDDLVVAKAAFNGDDDIVDAAMVHEALKSTFDPASKGAKVLDALRTADGKLDEERIEQVQVAYEKHYKTDIKTDFDAIGGLHLNEEPGKIWGKAIIDGDDTLIAAAKVRSGLMGGGTENEDIRAAFTMSPEFGDLVNQIERGCPLTHDQIASLNQGRGLTRRDLLVILKNTGFENHLRLVGSELLDPATADEPPTPEMISLVTDREGMPAAVRAGLCAKGADQGALLAAYARIVESQADHRARVAEIDKRYAETFDGASIKKDLGGDLSAWDYRYVETLRSSGVVPRAYRYMDACGGEFDGTDEDGLRELTRGRSATDIEADRKEFREYFHRQLDSTVLSEVSGDLYFDITEDLRGRPETSEEKIAAADRRLAHEESGWGETWYGSHKEMIGRHADLRRAAAQGDIAGIDKSYTAFGTAADSFRGAKNATADMVANVGATVVIVGGTVVVVTFTAGGAAPLMCVAAGGGALRMGAKAALKGDAYGVEEGAVDVGVAAVDVAVMGITPFASLGQAASNQILLQGGKSIASRGGVAVLTEEGAALAGKQTLMQLGQGSRLVRVAAGSAQGAIDGAVVAPLQTGVVTAMHEETWRNGFVDGLGTIAVNGVMMAPVGAAMGAPLGGALGLKTPVQLKLGRPLKPAEAAEAMAPARQPEVTLRSEFAELSPSGKTEFAPRAREMLAARQDSRGFITEADRVDADLMSASLSKSRSQKVLAQAKEAAKAGKMSDGEVQALERQLRVDGKLTKFEARAVEKALDPTKFQEPVTVMTKKMLDSHLTEANELASTLRKNLARDGISEVEAASLNSRLASVERRLEALHGVETAMKETQAMATAMQAARPTPKSTPLDDRADGEIAKLGDDVRASKEASKPLDDKNEDAIADLAAKRYVERNGHQSADEGVAEASVAGSPKDSELSVTSVRSESTPVAETPVPTADPVSPEVLFRQAKIRDLDERIVAMEKYLAHEKGLLEKAAPSSEPDVIEVAPGLKVPRKDVEAGHRAQQRDIENLRLEREAAVSELKAREDTERLIADSRARAAERAAQIREQTARNEASAAEARRAEVARRMNDQRPDGDAPGADIRAEAEATLRRQEAIHREFVDRMRLEKGSPIERYVPKTEKPKGDFERIVEIDDTLVRNEKFLKFLEEKLATGDESLTFDGFTMARADVEANVQALRQENLGLAAQRENLTRLDINPRPAKTEPRASEAPESEPVSPALRSDGDSGGASQFESPRIDSPVNPEPGSRAVPRPQRQPVREPARSQVQVLEREVNPDLERLLAQIDSMPSSVPETAAYPVEILEPSPALAKKLTQAQDKIAELEAAHARYEGKRGAQEVIEEELQKARQALKSLDERASLQSELKRSIREAEEQAASITDIAARKSLRRDLSRLEAKVNSDEGNIDLGAVESDLAALRGEMRSPTPEAPVAASAKTSSTEHLSVSETDDFLTQVFERNPDLYMSLTSKVDAEGRLSLHSIRETYAENGLELPREFGGSGELAPASKVSDEDGFLPRGDETSPDVDPTPRGGDDQGGGGTATMTKPKTEVKQQTEIREPELEIATETQAPAAKPKVEEPEVKTAPKTEEKTEAPIAKPVEETEAPAAKPELEEPKVDAAPKTEERTEAAPARPAAQPAEKVRVVAEPETSTAVETQTATQTASATSFKLQARPNSNTKVLPKVSTETAVQTAVQTGLKTEVTQAIGNGVGTRYPDEPPPGRGKQYMGGGNGGTPSEKKLEEPEAKRPEVLEQKETTKKVSAKEHEARKGVDKRKKLVGEDVDDTGTFIQGDLKVGWEKLAD